jgi:hypothetical protein
MEALHVGEGGLLLLAQRRSDGYSRMLVLTRNRAVDRTSEWAGMLW